MRMMLRFFSLDELAVADVSQESSPDVRLIDYSEGDIEEKQMNKEDDLCKESAERGLTPREQGNTCRTAVLREQNTGSDETSLGENA